MTKNKKHLVNESVYLPLYAEKSLNVESWLINSQELLKVAATFEDDINLLSGPQANFKNRSYDKPCLSALEEAYFMFIAYAIENMCKAIMISQNTGKYRSEIMQTKKLPSDLKTHNLVNLVRNEAGLLISEDEEVLLARLERNAVWSARYPVPSSFGDISGYKQLCNGEKTFISYFHRDDIKRIKALLNKIKSHSKKFLDVKEYE